MSERIAILGLGLMGGSLGLGLKRTGFTGSIAGYARRAETREVALAEGVADSMHADPAEAVDGADLVVICVPILATIPLLGSCIGALKPGTVVTDVGSTKQAVTTEADEVLKGSGVRFVGSHPIAGSERAGIDAATANLYDGVLVVVTAEGEHRRGPHDPVARVASLWERLGANVLYMSARRHDRILARTSHLPHMIAAILAVTVGRSDGQDEVAPLCGTGFLDTTRIAEGAPSVWLDILRTNRLNVVGELERFAGQLAAFKELLEHDDHDGLERYLQSGKSNRERIAARPQIAP